MKEAVRYIGLDTETVKGKAVLICTPAEECFPKTWGDCWDFIKKRRDYVTFNVSYDARALLAFLPGKTLLQLRQGLTGTYRGWKITYWTRKRLSISKGKTVVSFWDVYPYYESSLDGAARKWLGARKLKIPRRWLLDMSIPLANKRDRAKVVSYCKRDARLTQELWELVATQYAKLDIDPYRAASPATLATRAFPDSYRHGDVPRYVQSVFRKSYYGGRTEIYRRGNVGGAFCYDIHSAYPSALSKMVDPACCEAVRCEPEQTHARPGAVYGSYKVTIKVPPDVALGPVPFRPARGPLLYPAGVFTTWITKPELGMLASYRFGYKIVDGLELILIRPPRPLFPDIVKYYKMRQEVPAVSHAVKKTLNSIYGKLAETREILVPVLNRSPPRNARMHNGKLTVKTEIPTNHTHFAVAAAITGEIRVRLFQAMQTNPDAIVAVHTDGIVSVKKLDIHIGPNLGDWGLDHEPDEAIVIGCGIYLYRTGKTWTERTRGLHLDRPLRSLRTCKSPVCEFRIGHADTLADAARTGWHNLNVIHTIKKRVNSNMDTKRAWPKPWESFRDVFTKQQTSQTLVTVTRDVLENRGLIKGPRRRRAKKRKKVIARNP